MAAESALPARSLWRNRDYLLLWGGQVVSSFGSRVSELALPLLFLTTTGSALWAGILTGLDGLPFIVLSLPVGVLVDRWDRKRMLVLSDLGRGLALASVPVALGFGRLSLPWLIIVVLVEGTLSTFFSHARGAAVPRVVLKTQLAAAISQEQATESLAGMVGPAIGGALFGLNATLPFVVDAVTFFASACSLGFLRGPLQVEREKNAPSIHLALLVADVREGAVWLWNQPTFRTLTLLTGGLNVFSFGYPLIFILLAQRVGASAAEIGLLFATTGLGSLVGSACSAALLRYAPAGRIILVSAWVWAVTWPIYVLAPSVYWLGVVNLLGLIVVPIYNGAQSTYRLGLIPDQYVGRANSIYRLLTIGLQPLSLALAGALLQSFGPVWTVWIITVPQVLVCIVASFDRYLFRARLGKPVESS